MEAGARRLGLPPQQCIFYICLLPEARARLQSWGVTVHWEDTIGGLNTRPYPLDVPAAAGGSTDMWGHNSGRRCGIQGNPPDPLDDRHLVLNRQSSQMDEYLEDVRYAWQTCEPGGGVNRPSRVKWMPSVA